MSTITSEPQSDQDDRAVPPAPLLRRRWLQVTFLVALLSAGLVVGMTTGVVKFGNGAESASATSNAPTATAIVEQRRLVAQTSLNGTLVYADSFGVTNRIEGTVTALPAAGDTIEHGKPLYWIDNKPVILLRGRVPVYRELAREARGPDVQQLNAELVALGFAGNRVLDPNSQVFGAATATALVKLQKKFGLDPTGKLALGQVVFVPADAIRVSKTAATLGSPAPTAVILETTATRRIVTVPVEISQAASIKVGDDVSVTPPAGTSTPGKVTSIGAVATRNQSGSVTVDVLVEPLKPDEVAGLDQAPVQVAITTAVADNVLAVPVNALLALSGGRYAVEVVQDGDARKLYEVTLGLFDDSAGMVEVKGAGLRAGQRIVVPSA
ncbi:MAG TPA: peptidoglycan-binding domain-containing protein [Amycolatopsis sp.]|uniref:peptidoglycan-binding domain-containing protein n=1 Tax=Amycolatopsis sp. TaxID=37632 RepID=UPI002B47A6F4|nr:peptidoglycan-binding domain-containing protein [Amycolatopsis sp.]HKS49876.1 peptidoglycan-binding domain-containing protein [Amycolatopsis sp.]